MKKYVFKAANPAYQPNAVIAVTATCLSDAYLLAEEIVGAALSFEKMFDTTEKTPKIIENTFE